MAGTKTRYFFLLIIFIILVIIIATLLFEKRSAVNKTSSSPDITLPTPLKDTISRPDTIQWLADSTRIFLMKNTKLIPVKNYPVQREVKLDGDIFFEVPNALRPLIIRTKLLTLTVRGKAAFRVLAPAKEEWAEVQILSGTIIAKKAYSSNFSEPDTLQGNQMLMINRTIDLMEKEKFDATDLKAWRARLP